MTTTACWTAAARPGAVWAFDVDGTLIGSIRSDVLRPGAAELLAELAARGVTCVLWSAGGAEYAARMAARHGIDRAFVSCYSKEGRDEASRYRVDHFHAAHRPHVFVDDVPDDMPVGATVVAVPQFLGGNRADGALLAVAGALTERGATGHGPA